MDDLTAGLNELSKASAFLGALARATYDTGVIISAPTDSQLTLTINGTVFPLGLVYRDIGDGAFGYLLERLND